MMHPPVNSVPSSCNEGALMYPATNGVEAAHHGVCASEGSLDSILRELQSLPSGEGLLPKIGMSHAGYGLPFIGVHGTELLSSSNSAPASESLFGQMLASAPLTSAPICSAPVFPDASLGAAMPDGAMLAFMQQLGQQQQQPPPPQRIQTAQPLHHQRTSLDSSEEDPNSPAGAGEGNRLVKRQRRLQEKNRSAQKRYRERQKEKMHGFEKQVEDLSAQVNALMREKANLVTRNSLLERVVALKEEQQHTLKHSSQDEASSSICSNEEMLLGRAIASFHNAVRPRETPVTEQEARHWNHMCIFRLYNDYSNELLHAMLSWDGEDHNCPGYEHILHLVRAHQQVVLQLTMLEPRMVSRVICELKRHLPEDRTHWAKCVQAMHLSTMQRQHLLEMRSALFAQMEGIVQQRRRIIAELEASIPTMKTAFSGTRTHHQIFEQAMNASDELKESLDLEHREVSKLVCAFHASDLLTEIQRARCTVEAHPYMVDVFGITDAIAAEEGVESQGSFMASLMADMEQHGGSLMPSDSAFRIASLAPHHQPHLHCLQQGQDGSSDDPGITSPPAAVYHHATPVPFMH